MEDMEAKLSIKQKEVQKYMQRVKVSFNNEYVHIKCQMNNELE
jgi:hypothetical protein